MAVCALVSCQAGTEQTSKNEEKMNADKELKCEVEAIKETRALHKAEADELEAKLKEAKNKS